MIDTDYEIVIGLEIHAELDTETKVFCSCRNAFGSDPNTNCCPVCVGLPGALPVINKKAVEYTIKAGLAAGCEINNIAIFERKNYFYPDLSKAYQISQLEKPICINGGIMLDSGKYIRLNRIHLEEDAGKLIHRSVQAGTFIDYNRGGVPLIETVTEPDISSAEEAVEFLTKWRQNLIFAGVANCKMEQGGMRCDVNLSVRKKGDPLGTRTEMKNLNSFKSVYRAIEYEAERQIEEIKAGKTITQETRKWDDDKGKSFSMRSKEEAEDYRYFPDPDILTVEITRDDVESVKKTLPMLPIDRQHKYVEEYGLPEYDAKILTTEKYISDYFDEAVCLYNAPKDISNWIMTDLLKILKESDTEDLVSIITPNNLVTIIKLITDKTVTRTNGKELFEKVCATHEDAMALAKKLGYLDQMSTEDMLKLIDTIFDRNPKAIEDYKTEPDDVTNYFIGQMMRETRGKAKVDIIKPIIIDKLNSLTK